MLSATIKLAVAALYSSALDFSTAEQNLQYNVSHAFADGVGANQAQRLFTDQRTLAASATENLDLSGVLTDAFGASLAFTEVKALVIKAAAGNTNDVLVGGAASNGFITPFGDATDVVRVRPGGTLVLVAPDATGYAVTAGTGDLLKIANSAGSTSVTYDVVIVGN